LKAYGADGKAGPVAIPGHSGDLPTGTAKSIIKGLLAIGFIMALAACCMFSMLAGKVEAQGLPFKSPVQPTPLPSKALFSRRHCPSCQRRTRS
jgi:hypothetical protein